MRFMEFFKEGGGCRIAFRHPPVCISGFEPDHHDYKSYALTVELYTGWRSFRSLNIQPLANEPCSTTELLPDKIFVAGQKGFEPSTEFKIGSNAN